MTTKYISKIKTDKTIGYYLQMPAFINGMPVPATQKRHCKFFKKEKTWKAALKQAVYYRYRYFKENNALDLLNCERAQKGSALNYKRNLSGIIGVSRTVKHSEYGTWYRWAATWLDGKKQCRKSFAVMQHGEQGAFEKACLARYKATGRLVVTNPDIIPFNIPCPYLNKINGKNYEAC